MKISTSCVRSILAVILLCFAPFRLPAQAADTHQDMEALRQEVKELKARLAMIEAKLDGPVRPPMANALVDPQPSSAVAAVAAPEQATPSPPHSLSATSPG